jgi:erythromycin esterase-like protein
MRARVITGVLLACGLGFAAAHAQQPDAVVEWVRASAIPLTTPEAGHGFADLQPLKTVIGNARIVSLGEATHGSREFFQIKHRMLEFLASEMGFTIFSIEANMPEAYRLNDYVLNGTGDPAALLKGMYFWTWDTEEVLAMIRWMREFNQSGKGRVQFTGFDMQTPQVAMEIARTFVSRYDAGYVTELTQATAAAARPTGTAGAQAFGLAVGSFPVAAAAGKKVRYSGYIKTEGVTRGYAGLWWRVDGPSGVLAFDNMQTRGVTGTTEWTRYTIELPVDASVRNINFGVLMPGNGTAWFDDLAVELDGQPYSDAAAFDFGFEAAAPKGFRTSGAGYRVELDSAVAKAGSQSLRMRFEGEPVAAASPEPKEAVAQWKNVVAHLEAGRPGYRAAGASDRDIEWAIQNARVTLQCMQMRAGEVQRDPSMAANVKWILDQNPGAKIVLWAHNGHVATGGFSYETMGTALRRMYGQEMLVVGLGFNQGSFQAMAMNTGGLKNFTVPPALTGSLEAALADTKIPLFALDLRNAPDWFRSARGMRQIGAVYPEGATHAFVGPLVPAQSFDALLFVESTTVARKNPAK